MPDIADIAAFIVAHWWQIVGIWLISALWLTLSWIYLAGER